MRAARILILEDDADWIKTLTDVLHDQVSLIASANSLTVAQELIDSTYFNVAIVDISMRLNDPQDSQGMEFLKILRDRGLERVISPIVLSAYGSIETVRRAFLDYHIVDFLDKAKFDAAALRATVDKALTDKGLNRQLEVEVMDDRAISTFWSHLDWAKREEEDMPGQLEPELTDLLKQLFKDATKLFVSPLSTGQSGARVLEVEPVYGAQVGELVVLKFGKRETILREHQNYEQHIVRYVGYSSTQLDYVSGRIMGAIRYSLVGTELGELDSFAEFYAREEAEAIKQALDTVFLTTCGRWYDNREQPRLRRNLVKLYEEGLHIIRPDNGVDKWDEIWAGAEATGVDMTADRLHFPGIGGSFPNPQTWLARHKQRLYRPVWRAVTHGDLNEHNLLVAPNGRCWLIDFYRTGLGHILRDVVEMETAVKFSLTSIADLSDYYEFETTLLAQMRIDQPPLPESAHPYHKALVTIGYLRVIADNFTGSAKDMVEYHIGLLLTTLNLLRMPFFSPHHRKILLSAAMLCAWFDHNVNGYVNRPPDAT